MAEVTVGVPVFNAAAHLERCLECLRTQTFEDIEVLIFDNASTDETPFIAKRFVEGDVRFLYFRQQENKGAAANFIDALEASKSKYFMWRADDDLSASNFIEELYRVLTSQPAARLAAAPTYVVDELGQSPAKHFSVPAASGGGRIGHIHRMLTELYISSFYGLWHRETLRTAFYGAWSAYPNAWASDHLTLFPLILDEQIVTTNTTSFTQMLRYRPSRTRPPVSKMIEMRRAFVNYCLTEMNKRDWSPMERLALRWMISRHASNRCYGWRKIGRRYLREVFVASTEHKSDKPT